jgi:hypothetical protein
VKDQTPVPLTRDGLARLRLKALRRGLWFRKLNGDERALMNLVIRVVERVRSLLLAKLLSPVVKKLLEAMESEVVRMMRTVGRQLAQRLSRIAQAWGNKSAAQWAEDLGFIQYLAVTQKNLSPMFKA